MESGNMHDVLTIGVPLAAILAAILLNRADLKELLLEMQRRFDWADRRFDAIDAEPAISWSNGQAGWPG